MRHRPELDGLRGLAILLVVMHHSGWLPGGWIGVDLFFALSGYLITGLLMSEVVATGTIRMPAFYLRRAARLAPAFLVALPAAALLHDDAFGALAVLLYVANFALAFAPTGLARHGAGPCRWRSSSTCSGPRCFGACFLGWARAGSAPYWLA